MALLPAVFVWLTVVCSLERSEGSHVWRLTQETHMLHLKLLCVDFYVIIFVINLMAWVLSEQNGTFLMKIGAACVAFRSFIIILFSCSSVPAGVTKVSSDLEHCGFEEQLNTASTFWIQNQGYLTPMGSSSGVYEYLSTFSDSLASRSWTDLPDLWHFSCSSNSLGGNQLHETGKWRVGTK